MQNINIYFEYHQAVTNNILNARNNQLDNIQNINTMVIRTPKRIQNS